MWKEVLLAVMGASYGMLAAAGVFTVLVAVGLIPRFAGKTHTAGKVILFEEMVIFGTVAGSYFSIFERYGQVAAFFQNRYPGYMNVWLGLGNMLQAVIGIFSGMFIGCLALAIAEMLDSIPIFTRRISFRHGIGLAVLSIAAGKLCGSLFYFWKEIQ
ncbi:MAG: stage V sporulation protein AB [Bacteroidales bacterium]|nr:stage V sporulation protein AB [Lachnoclostridium sp.]MCM1385617.1 stage V sporulation protein AB [Lachnoclostridium sp.]MCM1466436.1 stage V sporulation protein AB [Bacteroidales bacterium]